MGDKAQTFTVTEPWVRAYATRNGVGWTRAQLKLIGVSWPLTSGWIYAAVGREISVAAARAFEKRNAIQVEKLRAHQQRSSKPGPRKLARAAGFARRMTAAPTSAEARLLGMLKSCQIRFTFQQPRTGAGGCYIVDFCVVTKRGRVVIEVDGSSHKGREGYDRRRTWWLLCQRRVIRVLRFTNEQVLSTPKEVLAAILALEPRRVRQRKPVVRREVPV